MNIPQKLYWILKILSETIKIKIYNLKWGVVYEC